MFLKLSAAVTYEYYDHTMTVTVTAGQHMQKYILMYVHHELHGYIMDHYLKS